jgi:hypothetical protein
MRRAPDMPDIDIASLSKSHILTVCYYLNSGVVFFHNKDAIILRVIVYQKHFMIRIINRQKGTEASIEIMYAVPIEDNKPYTGLHKYHLCKTSS